MSDYIGPLTIPTRTHHAEHNGSQVISANAMPEPVLVALVALVDALGAAFKASDDAEREADATGGLLMACPYGFNGTGVLERHAEGSVRWTRADHEVHISNELAGSDLLLEKYAVIEPCPAWPKTFHARRRSDSGS